MRLGKHLTIGFAVAAIAASAATAHDKPAKPDKAARCHPAPVMLAGTLAADPVSVGVDDKTLFRRDGSKSTLDALAQNDRAIVLAKVCRSDVRNAIKSNSALPAMTARLVLAKSLQASSSS